MMVGVDSRPKFWKRSNDAAHKEEHPSPSHDEWVPPSLRRLRAFSLTLFCVLFAAALQGLDSTIRLRGGLLASDSSIVNAVTYLPTLGTILVGFAWYGVVSDIKKVTPWSNMNSTWASSENCVSLDYVTRLEILSVFTACRRRHWAMFLALISALLCGITVALANSLVRIDLFAPSSRNATFTRDTRFKFENALVEATPDGYRYTFPTDYSGSRPYAAVQAVRDSPNDNPVSWTSGGFAFESFKYEDTTAYNSTLSATVQSFVPNMNCIPWSVESAADELLEAEFPSWASDDACETGFRQKDWAATAALDEETVGWLNVTTCKTASGRIKEWITARLVYTPDDPFSREKITQNQWLICDPRFTIQDAVVNVNKTTNKIISFSPLWSTAQSIQLEVPVSFIFMFLRNPFEPSNQWFGGMNGSQTERLLMSAIWGNKHSDPDTFFFSLADAETLSFAAEKYRNDSALFTKDVEALGNTILAQLVNFLAREQVSEKLAGSIETNDARLYLRRPFLHTLEAVLVIVGLSSGLLATILRPKTPLKEDPGPMSTAATMMANSSTHVRETFAKLSIFSEKEMRSTLRPFQWNIIETAEGPAWLKSSATQTVLHLGKESSSPTSLTQQKSGWNPLLLSLWARLSVSILVIGMIATLLSLLKSSQAHSGICDNNSSTYPLFTVLPTVILLLLGYACSGIDSAVRILSVFRSLKLGSSTSIDDLHVNVRDSPFFWLHWHGLRPKHSWALIASALCFLMIPGIKLIAAGLYYVDIFQTVVNVTDGIQLDASLTAHLNDNSSTPRYGSGAFSERVSTLTEWKMMEDWRLPERAGALGNLVFAEITDVRIRGYTANFQEGEVVVDVPAAEVQVKCSPIQVDLIGTYHNGRWKYQFECSNPDCQQSGVPSVFNDSINLGDPDPSDSENSYPGFNETGHWYNGLHKYYGIFGTPYNYVGRVGQGFEISSKPELWQVHFIDFSNTHWPMVNTTPVALNSQQQVLITPQNFGSHLPRISSVKCPLTLNTVKVKTTFTSSLSPTGTVQWKPTAFNNATIINRTTVDAGAIDFKDAWLQPQVASGMENNILKHSSTYFPTDGAATNFFELLAVYANNTLHNMSAYDSNPTAFTAAVEAVATSYTVQALLEMRPWARAAATPQRYNYYSDRAYEAAIEKERNHSMPNITGVLTYTRERVVQDATSTYVLIGLLSMMLACLGLVFVFSPAGPLLPKSPGSIAARMSLIAGSQLVRDLTEERIPADLSRMKDAKMSRAARLGWWDEGNGRGFRWGVDIGEGCVAGSWNNEPDRQEGNTERLLQIETHH